MDSPLLVFDLDGTLVDSAPDLIATLEAILPRFGFAADRDPTLRDGIGHGARHLIEYALHRQRAEVEPETLDAMHQAFIEHYEANICVETRLNPGIPDLLDRFAAAGWAFAVCTNKLEGLSRLVLRELGVERRFGARHQVARQAGAVPCPHPVPRAAQPRRHGAAHLSQAEKADLHPRSVAKVDLKYKDGRFNLSPRRKLGGIRNAGVVFWAAGARIRARPFVFPPPARALHGFRPHTETCPR